MTYPKFGVAGACEAETLTYRSDLLEYRDGFGTDIFPLKFTDTVKRNKPSYCAQTYGIGKSDDPTKNSVGVPLETVTMTEEEEVTTPHMIATMANQSPTLGQKLTYTDGLIFTRKKVTVRLVGKGDPPADFAVSKRGTTYNGTLTIKPAVGDSPEVSFEVPGVGEAGFYVHSVELGRTVTDWQKFTVELIKYVPNTEANAQVNMITPTLWTEPELQHLSHWYKITKTTTLHFNAAADVDETVELYDDSHETTATTTSTTMTSP